MHITSYSPQRLVPHQETFDLKIWNIYLYFQVISSLSIVTNIKKNYPINDIVQNLNVFNLEFCKLSGNYHALARRFQSTMAL